jgi:tRNA(Ile)-lysidine synthase
MRLDPAVRETRNAVRASLKECIADDAIGPGALVLAAVSGGADSLALAAALAWVGPRLGLETGAVVVDHQLQPDSAEQAERAARQCVDIGLGRVFTATTSVTGRGGPEAAARTARYGAIGAIAAREEASVVMTGHTLDDQAETVLLGLARGSGARSLAGMASRSDGARGLLLRPLLGVRRETTRAACVAQALQWWDDPHNLDPSYARSRARHDVLPVLEKALGPGVTEALARTAALLRADADALDDWAGDAATAAATPDGLSVPVLAGLPAAVRRRVLLAAAVDAGASAGSLSAAHVGELDRLVVDWHGQDGVTLPGGLVGERRCDRLSFR